MPSKSKLQKVLPKNKFDQIAQVFYKHFQFNLQVAGLSGKPLSQISPEEKCLPKFCQLIRESPTGLKKCLKEQKRGLKIANETGQAYITICHAGIISVCVPVMDKDTLLGGLFFGNCLWTNCNDLIINDTLKRLGGIRVDKDQLTEAIKNLPVVSGKRIQTASEFLFDLLYELAGFDDRIVRWRQQRSEQQSKIGEFIRERKQLGTDWKYPLESERELIGKVKIGDRTGAKAILNSILGTILFHNPGDLGVLKARLMELLSVLSRAAVEGGVDIHYMLEKNLNYLNKIMLIDDQEDLCAWISAALNEFIELVYQHQDSKKLTQITPAINYIDANYNKPITLKEIAKASCLSVSRLAHVFKEQMGITIIDYLTSVRIERAKQLLLATDQSCTEICFEVGYNNQSYFTRTFKELVGMTPRQFRSKNRRSTKVSSPV